MKRTLLYHAIDADIVIDLHCDSDAIVHMYTHDRLWPTLHDLAAGKKYLPLSSPLKCPRLPLEMGSHCHLLAPKAGGNPFDEACSCPWAELADVFSNHPIPMACESCTIELRGESDVGTSYTLSLGLTIPLGIRWTRSARCLGVVSVSSSERLRQRRVGAAASTRSRCFASHRSWYDYRWNRWCCNLEGTVIEVIRVNYLLCMLHLDLGSAGGSGGFGTDPRGNREHRQSGCSSNTGKDAYRRTALRT